jgi:hypothetical protein
MALHLPLLAKANKQQWKAVVEPITDKHFSTT